MSSVLTSYETYPDICPHCNKHLLHPTKVRNKYGEELTQNQIYRRHRRVHIGVFDVPEDEEEKYVCEDGEDPGLPEDCKIDTQTWRVDFHYTVVETVSVEASHRSEARELAKLRQTFDGEIMETVHTDYTAWGDPSQASEEYLKEIGLLPEDWEGDIYPEIPTVNYGDLLVDAEERTRPDQ